MAREGKISFILIATTLLWMVQMVMNVLVTIKEPQFSTIEEARESFKLLAFELTTKIVGIITVIFINWLLLTCSGGIHPVSQVVFIFISMVFAGDYGLPVAHFLDRTNNDFNHSVL